jgi:hypothetical protein
MSTGRPDLALLNDAIPALQGALGIVRALSTAETREYMDDPEMDAMLVLAAQQIRTVLELIERWAAHGEVG